MFLNLPEKGCTGVWQSGWLLSYSDTILRAQTGCCTMGLHIPLRCVQRQPLVYVCLAKLSPCGLVICPGWSISNASLG